MEYEVAVKPSARVSKRVRDEVCELLTDTENGLSTEQKKSACQHKTSKNVLLANNFMHMHQFEIIAVMVKFAKLP